MFFKEVFWLEKLELISVTVVYTVLAILISPLSSLNIFVSILVIFVVMVLCFMVSPLIMRAEKRRDFITVV